MCEITIFSSFWSLHHCCEEILVAQFFDVVQVLSLPSHVILLVVNPLLDELLRGIVVGEGCCQLAQLLDGSGLVVRLYLLLGVIVEGELDGLHSLL